MGRAGCTEPTAQWFCPRPLPFPSPTPGLWLWGFQVYLLQRSWKPKKALPVPQLWGSCRQAEAGSGWRCQGSLEVECAAVGPNLH